MEASHPIPDKNGLNASRAILSAVENLTASDLVVALVCGGGSALLPAPPGNLTLKDEALLNRVLLSAGIPISTMNLIRKNVSLIKGGRLALASYPAKVVTLVLSDVPGDELYQVASGPTVPDSTNWRDALAEIEINEISLPKNIIDYIRKPVYQCPVPQDSRFKANEVHLIGSANQSLNAALDLVKRKGLNGYILSDCIEGEAKEVAKVQAALAKQILKYDHPFEKPVILLSGGETSVTLSGGNGRGGRNSEFLLSLLLSLNNTENICALAADTDGIDGSEKNAGAFGDINTLQKIREQGLDPKRLLADHDCYSAFEVSKTLFFTGPTGTNINDFRAIMIT